MILPGRGTSLISAPIRLPSRRPRLARAISDPFLLFDPRGVRSRGRVLPLPGREGYSSVSPMESISAVPAHVRRTTRAAKSIISPGEGQVRAAISQRRRTSYSPLEPQHSADRSFALTHSNRISRVRNVRAGLAVRSCARTKNEWLSPRIHDCHELFEKWQRSSFLFLGAVNF